MSRDLRNDIEDALQRAERILVLIFPSFSGASSVETSLAEARKLFEAAPIGQEPRLEWDGATVTLYPPLT